MEPSKIEGQFREADLNEITQQIGFLVHTLYKRAEGVQRIYQSLAPIKVGRVQSIMAFLTTCGLESLYDWNRENMFARYQAWCMDPGNKSPDYIVPQAQA